MNGAKLTTLSILLVVGITRYVASKPVVTGGDADKTKVAVSITQDVLGLTVQVDMYVPSALLLNRVERHPAQLMGRLHYMHNHQRHHYRCSHRLTHTRGIQIATS